MSSIYLVEVFALLSDCVCLISTLSNFWLSRTMSFSNVGLSEHNHVLLRRKCPLVEGESDSVAVFRVHDCLLELCISALILLEVGRAGSGVFARRFAWGMHRWRRLSCWSRGRKTARKDCGMKAWWMAMVCRKQGGIGLWKNWRALGGTRLQEYP